MGHFIAKSIFLFVISLSLAGQANAQFDFFFEINPEMIQEETGESSGQITAMQQMDLQSALDDSAAFWTQYIVGFQPGVDGLTGVNIDVGISDFATQNSDGVFVPNGPNGTLAAAGPSGFSSTRAGFTFLVDPDVPDGDPVFTSDVANATRLGGGVLIDSADLNFGTQIFFDTLNHEIGHVLGFGTLFDVNGVLEDETGQYTGERGIEVFQDEFDPTATFVPIELDGGTGTRNGHLNERRDFGNLEDLILNPAFGEEGEPQFIDDPDGEDDPGDVGPALTVLTPGENFGRSLDDALLTGVLISNVDTFITDTTVATFEDIGFAVVLPSQVAIPEPSSMIVLGLLGVSALTVRRKRS